MATLSTHRVIQLTDLADRAAVQRVRYYCNSIKAVSIGNSNAGRYFVRMARKWESIRVRATKLLVAA